MNVILHDYHGSISCILFVRCISTTSQNILHSTICSEFLLNFIEKVNRQGTLITFLQVLFHAKMVPITLDTILFVLKHWVGAEFCLKKENWRVLMSALLSVYFCIMSIRIWCPKDCMLTKTVYISVLLKNNLRSDVLHYGLIAIIYSILKKQTHTTKTSLRAAINNFYFEEKMY